MKSADLYMWLGDGGGRDYSSYVGKKVIALQRRHRREARRRHRLLLEEAAAAISANWNLTRSDVWNCDFSSFTGTGTYRLAIEGVGCSPDFQISRDVYYEPFKTSVRGFFYMRIGDRSKDVIARSPPAALHPRQGPGRTSRSICTTLWPLAPRLEEAGRRPLGQPRLVDVQGARRSDQPQRLGRPLRCRDWDRHPGHISIIWDMLLPYLLSNGKIGDDNLQIAESGNGIPDIIDEARNEVDFWLRLRDGKGGYAPA